VTRPEQHFGLRRQRRRFGFARNAIRLESPIDATEVRLGARCDSAAIESGAAGTASNTTRQALATFRELNTDVDRAHLAPQKCATTIQ
jgi:hypothetical protein